MVQPPSSTSKLSHQGTRCACVRRAREHQAGVGGLRWRRLYLFLWSGVFEGLCCGGPCATPENITQG
jgi:hypothetical protein